MDEMGGLHNEFLDSLLYITPTQEFKNDLSEAKCDEIIDFGKGFFDRRQISYEVQTDKIKINSLIH